MGLPTVTARMPDDTRVVRDFDPEGKWEQPQPAGKMGEPTAQVIMPPNPAVTGGGVAAGGYRPIRPYGADNPPGYDPKTDMPSGAPGSRQGDPSLARGTPGTSILDLPTIDWTVTPPALQLVKGMVDLLTYMAKGDGDLWFRPRDPANGRFVSDPETPPSPHAYTDADRRSDWRRLARDPSAPLSEAQRAEIRDRGWRGPQRVNEYGEIETMELSHEPVPLRDGGKEVVPRWPADHALVDPFRKLKNRP